MTSSNSDLENDGLAPDKQSDYLIVARGIGRVSSEKLLGSLRELEIEHGKERYRLRITSTGKLLLTK
jgi:hemin uptake protein HemP